MRLYVTECDISKFFDSIHHKVIKKSLTSFRNKVHQNGGSIDERALTIFNSYLDSYSFSRDVLKLNDQNKFKEYWNNHKIQFGRFKWVKKELVEKGYFKHPTMAKIGVPQGGALSGLIANLVLDHVDRKVENAAKAKYHYVRFCDDMILINSRKSECEKLSKVYYQGLEELKLIPNEFKSCKLCTKGFWQEKSKQPYKWSFAKSAQKWIGFVGYEMNYDCEIRVRRKSLIKEKDKQAKVVADVVKALRNGKRKSDYTVYESVMNRLIGMSVGRVRIDNYRQIEHELCWVKGFELLTDNPQLRLQLKALDKSRSVQLSKLIKEIGKVDTDDTDNSNSAHKIKESLFEKIPGVSFKMSSLIRVELKNATILTKSYRLFRKKEFELADIEAALSRDFKPLADNIYRLVCNPYELRETIYYGKPFSYYYHALRDK